MDKLIIKVGKNGSWFATYKGKHLTAGQTNALIARGIPYVFS